MGRSFPDTLLGVIHIYIHVRYDIYIRLEGVRDTQSIVSLMR